MQRVGQRKTTRLQQFVEILGEPIGEFGPERVDIFEVHVERALGHAGGGDDFIDRHALRPA